MVTIDVMAHRNLKEKNSLFNVALQIHVYQSLTMLQNHFKDCSTTHAGLGQLEA